MILLKIFPDDEEEEEEDQADHIDLTRVLPHLNFLTHVELSFGVKDVGMNFEWGFFTVSFLFRTILLRTLHAWFPTMILVHNEWRRDASNMLGKML